MITLFKIKFAFKDSNSETGKTKKSKLEVIAQCATYTDAEKLAYQLASDYEMDNVEPYTYEISRLKFSVHDIIYTDVFTYEKGHLVCGLVQNYFEDEKSNLYIVNVCIYGENESITRTYCIPAYDVTSAINYVKSRLSSIGYSREDYNVISAKMDNALELYLLPETFDSLKNSEQK